MPETRVPPSSIPLNPEAMSWCHLHSQTNLPGQIRALLGSGQPFFTACRNPIKNEGAQERPIGRFQDPAWRRTHSLLSPDERESIAICDKPPRSPSRSGPWRASPIPGPLTRLGPYLGRLLGTRDPQPRASPSPRFNYVIDFRFGRAGTPLPSDCLNFSAPFLHFRVLLKGRHLETGPRAAGSGLGCGLALHSNEMVLRGWAARPALQPAHRAGLPHCAPAHPLC